MNPPFIVHRQAPLPRSKSESRGLGGCGGILKTDSCSSSIAVAVGIISDIITHTTHRTWAKECECQDAEPDSGSEPEPETDKCSHT